MARSQAVANKKNVGMKKKAHKNKKNVISYSDRKKNKIQVERLNKSVEVSTADSATIHQAISTHNDMLQLQKKSRDSTVKALRTKNLLNDQKKDKLIKKKIERKNKEAEDSMLKQIEMISGFSL